MDENIHWLEGTVGAGQWTVKSSDGIFLRPGNPRTPWDLFPLDAGLPDGKTGAEMFLTQTAEYALRAMAHLALLENGEPIRAAELSRATGIPVHYLSKIMRRMVLAGLVASQKGHGGGFVLGRPAAEIRFSDVLTAVGVEPEPDRCAFGWGRCSSVNPCPLHRSWTELNERCQRWAGETTLEDVRRSTKGFSSLRRRK